ncbi:MAG: PAS domain S-box protein [Planctomycetes bacterium]|nr:PAS domain S-box protein [Planctomycetota bacterium]
MPPKTRSPLQAKSLNLYKFIRLVLGPDISSRQIAQRWKMDEKNFHEFRIGKYPVPRIGKLDELASVLGVDKHLVFQVASGTPAQKVFSLIKKNDLSGQIRLLSNQLDQAHQKLAKSEKLFRNLFENANDAIFLVDAEKNVFIDCNHQAERLAGRSKHDIIGAHYSILIPPDKRRIYRDFIRKNIKELKSQVKSNYLYRADGTLAHVSVSTSIVEIDGRQIMQSICRRID